jgi:protein-S-isoprenylcysteine O-methyltransferase Ste14
VLLILRTLGWVICAIYSTIPGYWMLIHPRADYWRAQRSPYRLVLPLWAGILVIVLAATAPFRNASLYQSSWAWLPAACLFAEGIWLYKAGGARFSLQQLQGMPELSAAHSGQPLITTGVRARIRHPIYLAHFCEMLAWSIGTGLAVCFALVLLAIITGVIMIRAEDAELERRFGEPYRSYRESVPAIFPRLRRPEVRL